MCFRNSLTATVEEMEKHFEVQKQAKTVEFEPIYHANGFDYPIWPIITAQAPHSLQFFHWGLVPRWARSPQEALELRSSTLNAKIETLDEKPSFKYALQHAQRCLIPSTGFFEWQTVGKQKYPYFIHLCNQPLFAMAGIWETWHNPAQANDIWHTFSIITTDANPLMARIHNTKQRMPVIIPKELEAVWLTTQSDAFDLELFKKPIDDATMETFTIGKSISDPKSQSNVPEVLTRVSYPELSHQQLSLF